MATEDDSDQPAISGNDDESTVETGAGPDQDAEPSLNAPASGRPDGLADESTFDNPATHELYEWIDGMVEDGLLQGYSATDGQINQYLAVAQQKLNLPADAAANEMESQRLASIERATGAASRRAGIEWVTPDELARVSQPAALAPTTSEPAVATRPSARPTTPPQHKWR